MKILVETSGAFELVDPYGYQLMPSDRPAVVTSSQFVEARASKGQIKILGQLQDHATDADFIGYWKEAADIAVEAFKSEFGMEAVTAKLEKLKAEEKAAADKADKADKAEKAKADKAKDK